MHASPILAQTERCMQATCSTWYTPGRRLRAPVKEMEPCYSYAHAATTDGGCQQNLNEYAVKFNVAMKELITDLNSKLPGANFVFADGYDFFSKLIDNPRAYGENI